MYYWELERADFRDPFLRTSKLLAPPFSCRPPSLSLQDDT